CPGRLGSLDPGKRHDEGNALYRRGPSRSAPGFVHGRPQRGPLQPGVAHALQTPSRQGKAAQSRPDRRHAQTVDLHESSHQGAPLGNSNRTNQGATKSMNPIDKINTVAGLTPLCLESFSVVYALVPGRWTAEDVFSATAALMSAFNAFSSILSPLWKSMARLVLPSRLELKRPKGSFNDAPLAKVIFTTFLYVSPVQIIPACDHT